MTSTRKIFRLNDKPPSSRMTVVSASVKVIIHVHSGNPKDIEFTEFTKCSTNSYLDSE